MPVGLISNQQDKQGKCYITIANRLEGRLEIAWLSRCLKEWALLKIIMNKNQNNCDRLKGEYYAITNSIFFFNTSNYNRSDLVEAILVVGNKDQIN